MPTLHGPNRSNERAPARLSPVGVCVVLVLRKRIAGLDVRLLRSASSPQFARVLLSATSRHFLPVRATSRRTNVVDQRSLRLPLRLVLHEDCALCTFHADEALDSIASASGEISRLLSKPKVPRMDRRHITRDAGVRCRQTSLQTPATPASVRPATRTLLAA